MTQSSTVVLERLSLHIAKVTFSNPPVNLIAPDTVSRMRDIVVALRTIRTSRSYSLRAA